MAATVEERSAQATKRLARLAGAAYASLGLATLFGFYHYPLLEGDLNAIAQGLLTKSDLRFRIGVVADLVSTVLAVPMAWLLYELLKPVHKTQAALMALLVVVAIPITFVVALNYVAAEWLLSGDPAVVAFGSAQRDALAILFLRLHAHAVLAEEVFWGLWLVPFGLLVIRSSFLPRVLGILLIIAGMAYIAHSFTSLLLGGQRIVLYERVTMLARAAGEFPIMLWLLIRGANAPRASSGGA